MPEALLEIEDLITSFNTTSGPQRVLDGINLSIHSGKILGLVGESGCGKSITSLSIIRLLPQPHGFIENGKILFKGMDVTDLSAAEMESIRGNEISMIFQEPMTALNPVFTIGNQISEVLDIHQKLKTREIKEKCIEMLKMVGLPRAKDIYNEYPHQLSGGMRQRVMIAMALSCEPKLLIADEPTTALDVTVQIQILELIKKLQHEMNTAVLLITHDLGVIAEMCDDVAVMYLGKIVEETTTVNIFDNPSHPYTVGLLNSRLGNIQKGTNLICIPGMVPTLSNKPTGCYFSPRCPKCMQICTEKMPKLMEVEPKHKVRCWLYSDGEE